MRYGCSVTGAARGIIFGYPPALSGHVLFVMVSVVVFKELRLVMSKGVSVEETGIVLRSCARSGQAYSAQYRVLGVRVEGWPMCFLPVALHVAARVLFGCVAKPEDGLGVVPRVQRGQGMEDHYAGAFIRYADYRYGDSSLASTFNGGFLRVCFQAKTWRVRPTCRVRGYSTVVMLRFVFRSIRSPFTVNVSQGLGALSTDKGSGLARSKRVVQVKRATSQAMTWRECSEQGLSLLLQGDMVPLCPSVPRQVRFCPVSVFDPL